VRASAERRQPVAVTIELGPAWSTNLVLPPGLGAEHHDEEGSEMQEALNLSESVTIDAPPERVWDLVADVTRMGQWSPETTAASWLGGASGPAVGAKFKGRNQKGMMRWSTTCEVTTAERGREFSFVRVSRIDDGTDWSFTMRSEGEGKTVLTETAKQRRMPGGPVRLAGRLMFGGDRNEQLRRAMRTTIERIKAAAEKD
jgi:uncharacterized protein YndB with AHSA1/START domain